MCPTAIATEVFPNPGEPQIDTSRVDSDVTCLMISSHSLLRPVKFGTTEGRAAFEKKDFLPLREKNDIKGKRKTHAKVNK